MLQGKQNTLSLAEAWKIKKSLGFCRMASLLLLEGWKTPFNYLQEFSGDSISSVLFSLWGMKPQGLWQTAPGVLSAWLSLCVRRVPSFSHGQSKGCPFAHSRSKALPMRAAGSCCPCWVFELGFFMFTCNPALAGFLLGSILVLVTVQRAMV